MPHTKGTKITNHFKISAGLNNEMKVDFIFIGYLEDISYLKNEYFVKSLDIIETKFSKTPLSIYEVSFY